TVDGDKTTLKRFAASTRFVEPIEWPEALAPVRAQLVRGAVPSTWADVPADVVSTPFLLLTHLTDRAAGADPVPPPMTYTVLMLDGEYIRSEMLPSLARHHFQSAAGGFDYQLAVVPSSGSASIYRSVPDFSPKADATVDASADLFHLRVQDFGPLAA